VWSLGLQVVCPKYRRRILGGWVVRWLGVLLGQIVAKDVVPDHVHLFVRVGYVWESTVRGYIEHQCDAVMAS
jgi:hypothetical protein